MDKFTFPKMKEKMVVIKRELSIYNIYLLKIFISKHFSQYLSNYL